MSGNGENGVGKMQAAVMMANSGRQQRSGPAFGSGCGSGRGSGYGSECGVGIGNALVSGGGPVLTIEQERVLLEHLPVVRFLARRIHERLPQHVDIEDLVSAGVVGLMDAFTKFDPGKKVQFRSYAQFRIRGAILDSLRTLDWSP